MSCKVHEELPIGSTYGVFTIVGQRTRLPNIKERSYFYPCVCNVCGSKVYKRHSQLINHPVNRCCCRERSKEKVEEINKQRQKEYAARLREKKRKLKKKKCTIPQENIEICPGFFASPYSLQRKYSITTDDYLRMLVDQDFKCSICGKKFMGNKEREVAVDHDHKTGKVRGLLCPYCNMGLGFFKDSSTNLSSAIKYLGKYEKTT